VCISLTAYNEQNSSRNGSRQYYLITLIGDGQISNHVSVPNHKSVEKKRFKSLCQITESNLKSHSRITNHFSQNESKFYKFCLTKTWHQILQKKNLKMTPNTDSFSDFFANWCHVRIDEFIVTILYVVCEM